MPPITIALGLLASLMLLWASSSAAAAELPVPPCAGSPSPAWPPPGEPPAAAVWNAAELPPGWAPPPCSGLEARPGTTVVALAGSFREPGSDGMEAVLERLGALSRQRSIHYWSASRGAWRPMLDDAAALAGPDEAARRPDFRPEEFQPRAVLHVLYDDSDPVGPVVYESRVLEAGPDRLLLITRNIVPGQLMGFTIAEPGDIASMLALERAPDGVVRYYTLTTIRLGSMASALVADDAHVQRAIATFRFVAGLPSEEPPPMAPVERQN